MLTNYDYLQRLEGWLAEVTYKPGFSFSIRPHSAYGDFTLLIEHVTTDADGQVTGEITVASQSSVPLMLETRRGFLSWLAHELARREAHEALEWLRYDGERPFDPHPDGGTAYGPTRYRLED